MHDTIPHQLGLSLVQAKKLATGKTITIPHSSMGSHAGEHIIHLKRPNAKKLLSSYIKGKGVRISLSPEEIHHTVVSGSGFESFYNLVDKALQNSTIAKYAKGAAKYLSNSVGNAVGSYTGNPEIGGVVGDMLGDAATTAIENRSIKSGSKKLVGDSREKGKNIAISTIEQNISKLPKDLQDPAILAIKKTKGVGIKNHHYTTVKGDKVYHIGDHYVKESKTPYESDSQEEIVSGGKLKKGSAAMKEKMAKLRSMKGGKINLKGIGKKIVGGLKKAGHYLIPAATSTLGGLAGEVIGGPLGAIAGSASGSYAGSQLNKKLGLGLRGRGRPRKYGGDLASMTPSYKQAMRINYGLVDGLNNEVEGGLPISDYKTNPKVKPSPSIMTLSPYQRLDSPAMNPFFPTSGRGLMGYSSSGTGLMGFSN